ncbi:hypothetical protein HY250_02425 [Candidatus Azambacteria bacterium]|nr:hypothetical protein [Candidatus Azambacteria bacterium]
MAVHNEFQDFADRHYQWLGGRKHFGYLVKMAKKFGVSRCDEIISMMKHEKELKKESRIKYFNACFRTPPAKKQKTE